MASCMSQNSFSLSSRTSSSRTESLVLSLSELLRESEGSLEIFLSSITELVGDASFTELRECPTEKVLEQKTYHGDLSDSARRLFSPLEEEGNLIASDFNCSLNLFMNSVSDISLKQTITSADTEKLKDEVDSLKQEIKRLLQLRAQVSHAGGGKPVLENASPNKAMPSEKSKLLKPSPAWSARRQCDRANGPIEVEDSPTLPSNGSNCSIDHRSSRSDNARSPASDRSDKDQKKHSVSPSTKASDRWSNSPSKRSPELSNSYHEKISPRKPQRGEGGKRIAPRVEKSPRRHRSFDSFIKGHSKMERFILPPSVQSTNLTKGNSDTQRCRASRRKPQRQIPSTKPVPSRHHSFDSFDGDRSVESTNLRKGISYSLHDSTTKRGSSKRIAAPDGASLPRQHSFDDDIRDSLAAEASMLSPVKSSKQRTELSQSSHARMTRAQPVGSPKESPQRHKSSDDNVGHNSPTEQEMFSPVKSVNVGQGISKSSHTRTDLQRRGRKRIESPLKTPRHKSADGYGGDRSAVKKNMFSPVKSMYFDKGVSKRVGRSSALQAATRCPVGPHEISPRRSKSWDSTFGDRSAIEKYMLTPLKSTSRRGQANSQDDRLKENQTLEQSKDSPSSDWAANNFIVHTPVRCKPQHPPVSLQHFLETPKKENSSQTPSQRLGCPPHSGEEGSSCWNATTNNRGLNHDTTPSRPLRSCSPVPDRA